MEHQSDPSVIECGTAPDLLRKSLISCRIGATLNLNDIRVHTNEKDAKT
jgi:hypothetical protein